MAGASARELQRARISSPLFNSMDKSSPHGLSMSLPLAHSRLKNANRTSAHDSPEVPLWEVSPDR